MDGGERGGGEEEEARDADEEGGSTAGEVEVTEKGRKIRSKKGGKRGTPKEFKNIKSFWQSKGPAVMAEEEPPRPQKTRQRDKNV